MKIVSLEVENVKRLQAVSITPTGAVVVIGGENAQGKTSILDSIMMAIGGGKTIPKEPIRRGEKTASIVVDLGELLIERKFSKESGPSLVVKEADGKRVTSPQTILDKLVSRISFDPLAFTKMPGFEQFATLSKLLGLDFTGLDADRAKIYAERTVKNREVENQQHRVRSDRHFPNAPEKYPDSTEVAGRLEKANQWNEENRVAGEQLADAQGQVSRAEYEISRLRALLEKEEANLSEANAAVERLREAAERADVDTTAISQELAGLAEVRSQVEANDTRAKEIKALRDLEKASADMTTKIEKIDKDKATMIEQAKFPVEGLSFGEGEVLFNGLSLSEASDAEKLSVSVAMGISMNPKLKVLLIRDGSLLDAKHLELVAKMAADADAQVWIERVGEGAECQVIIEDGRVKETRAPADPTTPAPKKGELL